MSVPFADNPVLLGESEQAAFQAWVDAARPRLALSDWTITVTRHRPHDDAYAASFIRDHADEMTVAIGVAWRERTPEQLRHDLTHELLHPHFQRVTALHAHLIEKELGVRAEAIIEAAVSEVEEQTIDRLAGAIARFLPLLEIPGTTRGRRR